MMRCVFLSSIVVCLAWQALADQAPWILRSKSGVVASDSVQASEVGAAVMSDGGNAFDAAIATSFALGVTRPYSTGLGGGGFMLAYIAKTKQVIVLDFREMAPAGATPEHYEKVVENATGAPPTVYGGNAAGVPGLLAGIAEVQARFGTKPLSELAQGAAKLAHDGFPADQNFVNGCSSMVRAMKRYPDLATAYAELAQMFLINGEAPELGATLKNPALAKTLARMNDETVKSFYHGQLAQQIAAAAQAASGTLTVEDMANYQVRERQVVHGTYRGYDIFTMPPPSSGGIAILETLNILEHKLKELGRQPNAIEMMHLRIEAMKHAFADRARWLGDADFTPVPVELLTSKDYAKTLADKISIDKAGSPDDYGITQLPDDGGTSHFCITDKAGNIVSWTETINAIFGSFVVVPETGIILNNEMDDFLTVRGKANLYGLVQGEANLIGPGKRPLSCMSPTLVMQGKRPVLTLGASGGPRIITSVLNVMLNVLDVDLDLQQALESVRVHHQWRPDEVAFDRTPPEAAREAMKKLGHTLSEHNRTGIVQAIHWLRDGTKVAASDPRKGGKPAAAE